MFQRLKKKTKKKTTTTKMLQLITFLFNSSFFIIFTFPCLLPNLLSLTNLRISGQGANFQMQDF